MPPKQKKVYVKSPFAASPWTVIRHTESAPAAIARSPNSAPSARKIVPGRKCPTTARAATGAGGYALRMHPRGATTCTGRKLP